jgi:hypothetical protein
MNLEHSYETALTSEGGLWVGRGRGGEWGSGGGGVGEGGENNYHIIESSNFQAGNVN